MTTSKDRKWYQHISWAIPDYSVTSATGLTLMPECRFRTEAGAHDKNADAGLTFHRHFII
jgi:hypothetical protein